MFKQVLGTFPPTVFFERLKLMDSGSSVTVGVRILASVIAWAVWISRVSL